MKTKIPCRSSFVYIPKFGFIPKMCIVLISMMLTLALTVQSIPDAISTSAEAKQIQHKNPLVTQQDRIVDYMQHVNRSLDVDTAYQLADAIVETKKRYGMPIEIQLALIKRESNFEKYALGQAGELGFYQIMTEPHAGRVFKMMRTEEITTKNLYDPHTQAAIGGSIFKDCLKQRKQNMSKALACYNGTESAGDYSMSILNTAKAIKQSI